MAVLQRHKDNVVFVFFVQAANDARMVDRRSQLRVMPDAKPLFVKGILPYSTRKQGHILPYPAKNMRQLAADHARAKDQNSHCIHPLVCHLLFVVLCIIFL